MESKQIKEKSQKKEDVSFKKSEVLFLVFSLLIIFIVLFWIFQNPIEQRKPSFENVSKGNIAEFSDSLLYSDGLIIIENVSGLSEDKARYIYACGAGFAGSWGRIGKNISNLYTFVFTEKDCTYSSPMVKDNEILNTSTTTDIESCVEKINEMQERGFVVFDIRYGPNYNIYETKKAYVFINEEGDAYCSFRIREIDSVITTEE
ncbi:MAG: hypothetical protein NZ903_00785 [Candidatus Micrarchaeota archaeon]|nr:hypothetical protein [Candidatus Micrarchaeota archaeon]